MIKFAMNINEIEVAIHDKKPVIDEKALGVNPFIENLVIYTKVWMIPGSYKPSKDKDYEGKTIWENQEIDLEYETSTKLFRKAEYRKVVVGLSDKAKTLFLWILYIIEGNKDWVWINKNFYKLENDISSDTTYYNAINELQEKGLIMKTTTKDVLWINPKYFFSGSRIKKYPNNIEVKQ